jgi:4-hydroxybenzoate polyprenyltransferase
LSGSSGSSQTGQWELCNLSLLRALRVSSWTHFLGLPAAGAALPITRIDRETLAHVTIGTIQAAFLLSFAYLLNAYYDRQMDCSLTKNPLIANGDVPPRGVIFFVASVLAAASLVLSLVGSGTGTAATVVCLVCGWAYSATPRLKRLPIIGTLLNVGIFAPLGLLGLRPGSVLSEAGQLLLALFSVALVQSQLLHEHEDIDEDEAGGVHSTRMLLGYEGTLVAVAVLSVLAASVVGVMHFRVGLVFWGVIAAIPGVLVGPLALARARGVPRAHWARRLHRRVWLAAGSGLLAAILLGPG